MILMKGHDVYVFIHCDPSLEPPGPDGPLYANLHVAALSIFLIKLFSLRNKKNYPWIIPVTPS